MFVGENIKGDYLQLLRIKGTITEGEKIKVSLAAVLKEMVKSRGFRAVVLYRIGRYFRIRKHRILAVIFGRLNRHLCFCTISTNADIGPGFTVIRPYGLLVGGGVRAGKNLILSMDILLGGNVGKRRPDGSSQPILGDNVNIAIGSRVVGPISIGDNCLVGANSVVISDMPSNCTVAGVPARIIKREGRRVGLLERRGELSEILNDLLGRIQKLEQQVGELKNKQD